MSPSDVRKAAKLLDEVQILEKVIEQARYNKVMLTVSYLSHRSTDEDSSTCGPLLPLEFSEATNFVQQILDRRMAELDVLGVCKR